MRMLKLICQASKVEGVFCEKVCFVRVNSGE